jgi:curli biogenesis system outer membrane secretion channel CsgG
MRVSRLGCAVGVMLLAGCQATMPTLGGAQTVASGATAGENTQNASSQLERCDSPLGTVAVIEESDAEWYRLFTAEYKLGSTVPVLRQMIQQSNCFVVVERGRAFAGMERERALAAQGQTRGDSNFGAGQIVAADFSLTPEVVISARGTSGIGGGLAGFSPGLAVLGAIASGIRKNEAATVLLLSDNRSGVQVSASQGSASNTDFNVGAVLFGSVGVGGLGAYTNTPQGKVVVAAFMDSYNHMVKALRDYKPQSVKGQGLGTGGKLAVDGASTAQQEPKAPPAPATSQRRTPEQQKTQQKTQ